MAAIIKRAPSKQELTEAKEKLLNTPQGLIKKLIAASSDANELNKTRKYWTEFTFLKVIEELLLNDAIDASQLSEVAIDELDKSGFFDKHGLVKPQLSTLNTQPTVPIQIVEEPEFANYYMGWICKYARE